MKGLMRQFAMLLYTMRFEQKRFNKQKSPEDVVKYMYKLTVHASHHKCNKYMLKKVKLHNITT